MAKAALKTKLTAELPPALGLPALSGFVKDTNTGDQSPAANDVLSLVRDGWELKNQKDTADKALKGVNTSLLEKVGVGASVTLDGVCSAALTERVTVEVIDVAALKEVLGPRFEDLVNTTVTHKPTDKLLEIASSADHPLHEAVAACLCAKTSESVTYRAVKAK